MLVCDGERVRERDRGAVGGAGACGERVGGSMLVATGDASVRNNWSGSCRPRIHSKSNCKSASGLVGEDGDDITT